MPSIGLVLGGGGIVGQAYHGGVLDGLQRATGWDPRDADVVVGTSAGSASGAELRAGLPVADMAARRAGTPFSPAGEDLLLSLGAPPQVRPSEVPVDLDRARAAFRALLARSAADPAGVRPGVLTSIAMSPGRLPATWLQRQVEWLNGGTHWPAGAFWCCAIDLEDGTRAVFGSPGAPAAEPGQAVAASCAIPGVFAPVEIGGRLYIDGGGWSPTNADVLAGRGLDLVIVLSPMSAAPGCARDRRDLQIRRACRAMLMEEVALLRRTGTPVAVIEPCDADLLAMGRLIGLDVLDEGRCDAVVAQVRASTAERIAAGALPELALLAGAGAVAA